MNQQEIKALQQKLNENYPWDNPIPVTGLLDPVTKKRVKDYQNVQGLVPDGDPGQVTLDLLRGKTLKAVVSPDPPENTQSVNRWRCWAHALNSFQRATNDPTVFDADAWVDMLKRNGLTGHNDGLTPQGWDRIRKDLNMPGRLFTDGQAAKPLTVFPRSAFGVDTLYKALKEVGYLLMVYNISTDLAHTIVVNGIQLEPDTKKPHYINIMDPWQDGRTTKSTAFLRGDAVNTVGIMFRMKGSYKFTARDDVPFRLPALDY